MLWRVFPQISPQLLPEKNVYTVCIFSFDREHKPQEIQTLQSSTSNVSKSPLVSSFITCSSSFLYSEPDKQNSTLIHEIRL